MPFLQSQRVRRSDAVHGGFFTKDLVHIHSTEEGNRLDKENSIEPRYIVTFIIIFKLHATAIFPSSCHFIKSENCMLSIQSRSVVVFAFGKNFVSEAHTHARTHARTPTCTHTHIHTHLRQVIHLELICKHGPSEEVGKL